MVASGSGQRGASAVNLPATSRVCSDLARTAQAITDSCSQLLRLGGKIKDHQQSCTSSDAQREAASLRLLCFQGN